MLNRHLNTVSRNDIRIIVHKDFHNFYVYINLGEDSSGGVLVLVLM